MIPHEKICDAAERIFHWECVHGDKEPVGPLFTACGIEEEQLAHFCKHAVELGIIRPYGDATQFAMGILFALLATDQNLQVEDQLSDRDVFELLNGSLD